MFCPNCGTEIMKEALFCGNCGFKVEDFVINTETPAEPAAPSFEFTPAQEEAPVLQPTQPVVATEQNYSDPEFQAGNQFQPLESNDTLVTVTKIFLIIGCVINAVSFWLIPLAWCIPMTLSIFKSFKTGRPIGMGMKICTLLFVNLIAGICLLCMKDDRK